jgi:hypothetical protein
MMVGCAASGIVTAEEISIIRPNQFAVIHSDQENELPRTIMSFDLGAIPANDRIDFAQVIFHPTLAAGKERLLGRVEVFPLTRAWQADAVGWSSPWSSPGGDLDRRFRRSMWVNGVDTSGVWLEVTPLVLHWKAGDLPNFGIVILGSPDAPLYIESVDQSVAILKVWHCNDGGREKK